MDATPPEPNAAQGGALAVVRSILAGQCDCAAEARLESRLVEDLELESLALLTLVTELENHYRVALEVEDYAEIRTVADVVERIERAAPRSP